MGKAATTALETPRLSDGFGRGRPYVLHLIPSISFALLRAAQLDPLRGKLNTTLKKQWQEWEIPSNADKTWPETAKTLLPQWWEARISRQKEMDVSIAAKAVFESF